MPNTSNEKRDDAIYAIASAIEDFGNHITEAIFRTQESPNVVDSNFEVANVVDVIDHLAINAGQIAHAIKPTGAIPGEDRCGGKVGSLTESVMGITSGLVKVADAIDRLACAIEDK